MSPRQDPSLCVLSLQAFLQNSQWLRLTSTSNTNLRFPILGGGEGLEGWVLKLIVLVVTTKTSADPELPVCWALFLLHACRALYVL